MGRRGKTALRHFDAGGNEAPRPTAELRIRLADDTAKRLLVAAAVRGSTPSELVEIALVPWLAFELPELPDVEAYPTLPRGAQAKRPGAA